MRREGDTGCSVTVLRTTGQAKATKEWAWSPQLNEWRKISYQAGAQFLPAEHPVSNLAELVEVIDQARRDPRAFVVRGGLTEAAAADPTRAIRRRKHVKGGVDATLVEVPRRWLPIDIDDWPLRASDDLASDPLSAIDHAITELLPEAFHDAECWWQLSASAGFTAGYLKCHLWFWLTEPATNLHVKAVLKQHAPGVDRAPYSAAQPIYIADPIVEGGHDPLPVRAGWRRGMDDAVTLPALRAERVTPYAPGERPAGTSKDVASALATLGHGEGRDGFHEPIRRAAWLYSGRCNRYGGRDDAAFKVELRHAIRSAPVRPGSASVETPYCQDFYLDSSIQGAFAKRAGDEEVQTMRPHHAAATATLDEARAELPEHVGEFFTRALEWHALKLVDQKGAEIPEPEHAALVVGVGAGKSTAAMRALLDFITRAKAAGLPHRVLWLVPTHKLGNQALADMKALGLNVAVMRGRDAEVPGSRTDANDGRAQKMCLNLEAVEDALSIHATVETAVCGVPNSKKPKPLCPWRVGEHQCAFQRQKHPVSRADVVIAAHASMFFELAKEIRGDLGAVVVDESWWQSGLSPYRDINLDGFGTEPIAYPVRQKEAVAGHSKSKAWRSVGDTLLTNELHEFSVKAAQAFDATGDGDLVSKAAVEATGLTAANCASAYALEWRRMVEGVIYPGQAPKDRRKLMELAAGNAGIPRRAALWRVLQALLEGDDTHTGRLQMGTRKNAEGTRRVIVLHTRMEVREEVAGLPMLHLDATMPLRIVRYFLPRLELLAEVNPVAPHMEVRQVIGGWGKTSLVTSGRTAPDEAKRRGNLVRELADFAGANSGGNGLVITYEAIEAEFAKRPGIRTGHFNAIAGLDTFKDVRSLFVIGRPLPDASDLRGLALALTGRDIPEEQPRAETRGALMEDGTGASVNVRVYADPDLEALRTAITEAEIIQAVGRGRGVNRTADTPLTVFLFADVATGLPVSRMVRWADIRPGVVQRMAGRGLVLASGSDAAVIYDDLFATPGAARMAFQRERVEEHFCHTPLREDILGGCDRNRFSGVAYRPEGRGQQTRKALVLYERLEGLAEWLTEKLGKPVHVLPDDDDPEPPKPGRKRKAEPMEPDATPHDGELPDDLDENLPEPPEDHPAFQDLPPDAGWDRQWTDADDARWAEWEGAGEEEVPQLGPVSGGCELDGEQGISVTEFHSGWGAPPTCDAPWLHPPVSAVAGPGGSTVLTCPFCGELHRHRGYGHRLAHCADPQGRGYVLQPAPGSAADFRRPPACARVIPGGGSPVRAGDLSGSRSPHHPSHLA